MRITKAKFTVSTIKPFRDHQLEGEAEGKLGKELRIKGAVPVKKCAGLYRTKESFALGLGNLYDENGALLSEDEGKKALTVEGRACKAMILYGLVDAEEFEDVTFDCIAVTPEKGGMVTVNARVRLHPTMKQMAKLDALLKNEITLTINGQTMASASQDDGQEELNLGGPKEDPDADPEDAEPPRAGKGELLPGVPDPKAEVPAAHRDSVEDLRKAGVLAGPKGDVKPSLAHGEPAIPGGKPPQRPRRRPTDTLQ